MKDVREKEFTHLKVHTQYSICEGALRTSDLAKYCKTNNVKAVGLCDSYNLCGALEFSESLVKSKTQPIIGTQINIKFKNQIGKLPIFAKNLVGYKNLIKLSSKSFLEIKDFEVPHCKYEDLEEHSEGLILLSGTFDGLIGNLFFKNLTEDILTLFKRIKNIFKKNFYIEIQRHKDNGEKIYENFLLDISKKVDIPLIATHEVFYLDKDMFEAHDAYLCVGQKTYVNSKDRKKYTNEHYLKTSEEMNKIFHDLPEALENNFHFPFRISYRPKNSSPVLPNIQTNKTDDNNVLLIKFSKEGLDLRLKEYVLPNTTQDEQKKIKKIYYERLEHEINIISKMKYSSYFLIVSDYIKWAKNNSCWTRKRIWRWITGSLGTFNY